MCVNMFTALQDKNPSEQDFYVNSVRIFVFDGTVPSMVDTFSIRMHPLVREGTTDAPAITGRILVVIYSYL